jgi:KDO2-lipid IV(A) lauroyltransferase
LNKPPATVKKSPARKRKPLGQRMLRSRAGRWATAKVFRGVVGLMQRLGPERSAALASGVLRTVGPLFPEHRLAARNIARAFPGIAKAEQKRILSGVWDNLARVGAEYIHLDAIAGREPVLDGEGDLTIRGAEHFFALRDDGKPGIIFAAHLANWELLAVAAARYGLPVTAIFRPPANLMIGEDILRRRRAMMGGLVANARGATFELMAALERGEHLGILVDQAKAHGGLAVPFFGRPAPTNPLVARLARAVDCPVHGARTVRLPGGRFVIEVTPPLDLPRDAEGRIDVYGATAMIASVVEGWVREHPEQWLWLHDRWRD